MAVVFVVVEVEEEEEREVRGGTGGRDALADASHLNRSIVLFFTFQGFCRTVPLFHNGGSTVTRSEACIIEPNGCSDPATLGPPLA